MEVTQLLLSGVGVGGLRAFGSPRHDCPNRKASEKSCVQAKIVHGESCIEHMTIPRMDRSFIMRYAVAVLSAGVAAGLTAAIEPFFHGKAPLFFFVLAALVSAALGGLGPGLVATGLGFAIVVTFFQAEDMAKRFHGGVYQKGYKSDTKGIRTLYESVMIYYDVVVSRD